MKAVARRVLHDWPYLSPRLTPTALGAQKSPPAARAHPRSVPPPPRPGPGNWQEDFYAVRDPADLLMISSSAWGRTSPSLIIPASLPPPIYWRGNKKTFNLSASSLSFSLFPLHTKLLTLVSYLIPRLHPLPIPVLLSSLQGTQRPNRGMRWSLHLFNISDACSPDSQGALYSFPPTSLRNPLFKDGL